MKIRNKLLQILCDAALPKAQFTLLPWKKLCIFVGTNSLLGVFFWRICILMERYTRKVDTSTTCCIQSSAVAGRVVSDTSDKTWAIPSLVLEKMAVVWWVWQWPGSGLHLRAAVFLSGCGPSVHRCHEESCCAEAVIAELVGSSRQVMPLLHLLLLQKYLCNKLMSSAICL